MEKSTTKLILQSYIKTQTTSSVRRFDKNCVYPWH